MAGKSAHIPLIRTKLHRPPIARDHVHLPMLSTRDRNLLCKYSFFGYTKWPWIIQVRSMVEPYLSMADCFVMR